MEVEAWAAEGFRCVIRGVITVRVFKGFAHSGGIERHYGPGGTASALRLHEGILNTLAR